MYFQKFPVTYYSLDDRSTVQVVTNITLRNVIGDEIKNNFAVFDEYDIKEGETPELVADKFYSNPSYHWVVLHMNDILDPRYGWLLSQNDLNKYVEQKYNNINAPHHYEDGNGVNINGNVYLNSGSAFVNISAGDVVLNNTNVGLGVVTSKISDSTIIVTVTNGGFIAGDQLLLGSNANVSTTITSTSIIEGTPITNYEYEDAINESKRRIKILKPQYLDSLDQEFTSKIIT